MMAGAFGFGPLNPLAAFGGSPSAEDLARALAEAAGGGPAGFTGAPGVGLPSAPGLPVVRPRPPFGFGGLPAPQMPLGAAAPESEGIPVEGHPLQTAKRVQGREQVAQPPLLGGAAPGAVNAPLPPARPPEFGGGVSPADMPVQGAVPAMGQAPVGDEGASFLDRLGAGIRDNSDYLGALGAGLLSAPTFAGGLSAGMQLAQRTETQRAASGLARAEQALRLRKLAREEGAENQTKAFLIRSGHAPETAAGIMAAAAAGDRTALSAALSNAVPKNAEPSFGWVKRPDGSYAPAAGGPEDPAYKRATAQASAEGAAAGKPDEPFNLSPGQVRYDASGRPIASAPKEADGFDREAKLRGEFAKGLGTFQDVHDGYGRVIAATRQRETNPGAVSPASDIGLVFGFMKMLDPGSVVREGEYATAKNAAGIPDQVRNAYNKALNGEFLTSEQRRDFVGQAGELYGTARKTAEGVAGRYRGLAGQYGVDPDRATYLPEAPVAPTFGALRGGQGSNGQAGFIPAGAADMLRSNPSLRSQFDAKYGAGAADAVLGRR